RTDDAYLWFGVSCAPLPGKGKRKGGGDGRKVVTCHEISVRKRLRDQLSYQADHDALTGLQNRAVFDRRVAELTAAKGEADDGDRALPRELAVLFVDLDFFKPVNDTYGHGVGDRLLQVVGARLQAAAREDDLVCRVGGDEFAILLEGADPTFAEEVAARVLDAVRRPVLVEGLELQVGA
nr:GGDEF domain-containing protein [Micromonospora sp. DSM 115978]